MQEDEEDPSLQEEEEEEDTLESRALYLEEQLKSHSDSYDLHVEYISTLRQLNQHQLALHRARQAMHSRFPLSVRLWMEWVEDCTSSDDKVSVLSKAVEDYSSALLWKELIGHAELCRSKGEMNEIWNRCLKSVGRDYVHAAWFWKRYVEFVGQDSAVEVFRQALGIPMKEYHEMEKMFVEFEKSQDRLVGFEDQARIKGVKKWVQKLSEFEDAIEKFNVSNAAEGTKDAEHQAAWSNYLAWLNAKANEMNEHVDRFFVPCVYERAINDLYLHSDLWARYILICQSLLDVSDCYKVCKRAVRNCPWSSDLWANYLRLIEQFDQNLIEETFEAALQVQFQSSDSYLVIFKTIAEIYRRKISLKNIRERPSAEDSKFVTKLQLLFKRSEAYMEYIEVFSNHVLSFLELKADFNARIFDDVDSARNIWNDILRRGSENYLCWLGCIEFEKMYGNLRDCHNLFVQFFEKFENNSNNAPVLQAVTREWVKFESIYGDSLESYNLASRQYGIVFNQVGEIGEYFALERKSAPVKRKVEDLESSIKRSKTSSSMNHDGEDTAIKEHDDEKTVFIVNLPFTATEKDLKDLFSQCGNVREVRFPKKKGLAYVEFEDSKSVPLACSNFNRHNFRGNQIQVVQSRRQVKQEPVMIDGESIIPTRVFVGGIKLGFNAEKTIDGIQKLFLTCGAIRELKHSFNEEKPKDFVFIDFFEESSVPKALLYDGTLFKGSRLKVKRARAFDPTGTKRTAISRHQAAGLSARKELFKPHARPREYLKSESIKSPQNNDESDVKMQTNEEPAVDQAPKSNEDFRNLIFKRKR